MEWGLGGPGPEMRGLASWRTEQEVLRGSCPRRCFGTYISQLGLSFPNYNKWPHLGHQPFGTRQPFSSVRACEWVRRAGSAHTPPPGWAAPLPRLSFHHWVPQWLRHRHVGCWV